MPEHDDNWYTDRGLSLDLPDYMRDNLRTGLRLHEEGRTGDGLQPATVRDARTGAEDGVWTADKWARAAAWFERHEADFGNGKAPFNASDPGAGEAAWYLWGGNESDAGPADWRDLEPPSGRLKANQIHERIKALDSETKSVSRLRQIETGSRMNVKGWRNSVVKMTLPDGMGSGVLIRPTLIATAYHVVAGCPDGFEVRSPDGGKVQRGEVVHVDGSIDLALVSIPAPFPGAAAAPIVDTAICEVGEESVVIGYPWGDDTFAGSGGYVTRGNISGLEAGRVFTDAAVNPGNSGGGLFTGAGLVGVISATYSMSGAQSGISYAIDASLLGPMLEAYDAGAVETKPEALPVTVERVVAEFRRYAASHRTAPSEGPTEVAAMADNTAPAVGATPEPVEVADDPRFGEMMDRLASLEARLAACEEMMAEGEMPEMEPESVSADTPMDSDHAMLALEVAGVSADHADLLLPKVAEQVKAGAKVRDAASAVAKAYPMLVKAPSEPAAAPVAPTPAPVPVSAPMPAGAALAAAPVAAVSSAKPESVNPNRIIRWGR